uniref:FAD-binding protein n=1 Tax=Arthrobacter sp. ERGS1:01 TaxID=1704044 RepID=UPI000B268536
MAVQQDTAEWNWAGNYSYGAAEIHRPATVDQLRALVAGAAKVRALGSRHSFNSLADSDGILVSLAGLEPTLSIDAARSTATVNAGITYGMLAAELKRHGKAVHNLASLPHISIAGAVATATHGSGTPMEIWRPRWSGWNSLTPQGRSAPSPGRVLPIFLATWWDSVRWASSPR